MKQSRWANTVWLPACVLMTVALWLGCEQKGDISPTGGGQHSLTFIDTVMVDPANVLPGANASIGARILNEANEPAVAENVRFTVNRGVFTGNRADTTIATDQSGWARTTFTAPQDTCSVLLRAELLSMSEVRSSAISVYSTQPTTEGLLTTWAERDTLFADNGISMTHVYARLRNETHNPVGGAVIRFTSTVGSITSPEITDSTTGTATATLYSTNEIGVGLITAFVGSTFDTTHVQFLTPAQAGMINVTSSRPQLTAGRDSTIITARVFDTNNQPVVNNTLVFFATSSGILSNLTGRTLNGVCTTVLFAPPAIGNVTVTATTGGTVNGSATVLVTPGPAATVQVTSSVDTLLADNSSEATITALVMDAYNNPVSEGTPVSFTAQGGTVSQAATVGSDGRAAATFRAGLTVGPAAVTATQNGIQGSVTFYLRGTLAAVVSLTADSLQLVANGTSTAALHVTVLDNQNRPVSDGTPVTFSCAHGVITGNAPAASKMSAAGVVHASNWSATLGKSAVRTGATKTKNSYVVQRRKSLDENSTYTTTTLSGYASATLTSPTLAGLDTVTADANSVNDSRSFVYSAGSAAIIQVVPQATTLPADGISSTPVNCTVTDRFGNHLGSGVQVTLTSTLGHVSPSTGYTNNDGGYSTTLVTTRQRGLCAIVATTAGANGYGEVSFAAPQVASVALTSDLVTILANGLSSARMIAYASDAFGLPVQGISLDWQIGAGVGHLAPISLVTDTLGLAYASFYSGASRTDVEQNVTAGVGTHSDSRTIHMVGIVISAWSDATQLPANGDTTTPFNVLVREATSGIAIPNATVSLAATLGSIGASAVTNSSGVATATYRAATQPGQVQVTALYGDTLRAEAALRLTSVDAETLLVTVAQSELLADGIASTAVSAIVYNEGGQVVANTPVTFTPVGPGTFVPNVVTTDQNGRAVSTYHSASLVEDQQVGLNVAIERASDEKPLTLRGVTLHASAHDLELPADGSSTTQIQIDLRQTSTYMAIPNASIHLGTNIGSIPAVTVTDSSGIALVTFTTSTEPGTAEIITRYGNLHTDTVRVTLFTPSASALELNATRLNLLGSGADSSRISTHVTDQRGVSIPNATVTWSVTGLGSMINPTTTTDPDGNTVNYFVSPASATDVSSQVVAHSGQAVSSVTIASRGVTLTVSPLQPSIRADGVSNTMIHAYLRETTSTVAISGVAVRFGTSLGTVAATANTDASGTATVTLISSSTAGRADVIARYGNLLTDTTHVTFYAATAYLVQVYADNNVLRGDGISSTPVRAFVYDQNNLPLANVAVRWSAASGTTDIVETETDSTGMAGVIFFPNASTMDRTLFVTASAGTTSGSVTIQMHGVTVTVTANPQAVIADGSSTSTIRAHIYETTTSVAVSGARVTFGTTLGTIPNFDSTDVSGLASVVLQSSTQTGTAIVEARYGNLLTATVNVTFAPSTPTSLSLTASPTILPADNASQSTLTAVVTDQNGNPVPNGTQVRFSIPPQSGSMESLRSTHSGVAINTLTSSSSADTVMVTVWADANPSARDSATIIYTVGAPAVVTLSAQRDTLPANGITVDTVIAHVTDAVGHVLANVDVRFSTTIGNITASNVTDANGVARVPFSSSHTGTARVTATAGVATGGYTIYLVPGSPNSIAMEYLPSSVGVRGSGRNESLLITATVRDANNNPVVDGTPVYFNIAHSPGGGDFLSSTGAIPTINGRATVSYSSGTVAGSARIRALCESISAVSTEILVYAGPPFIEDIYNPCETSHMSLAAEPCNTFGMNYVGDSLVLVALVGDRYNNPVTAGTAVYFTTSAGVITTATGYTDSLGFARVTLYSGSPWPSIDRWRNTITDPNLHTAIYCTPEPPMPGVVKVVASSAGVDANGDSVTVWGMTEARFIYTQPNLFLREAAVNGDPTVRELYIGQNAVIRVATFDNDFWPLVAGSVIRFSSSKGLVYPPEITIGCPGDTSYAVSFFNNLTLQDQDAASPVLISVDTRQGDAYAFTETFLLHALLPHDAPN